MAAPPPIVVGYALREKRVKSFFTPELLQAAEEQSVKFVSVTPTRSIAEQGPFDLLIHKLEGDEWASQLTEYEAAHPEVVIIDKYSAVHRLDDRTEMLEVVENMDDSRLGAPIEVPKQFSIGAEVDPKNIAKIVAENGLKLPFVVKPIAANGTVNSHQLCLVVSKSALSRLEPPVILQEFVNHGGILFKLYVLGDVTMVFKRQSLPDIPTVEETEAEETEESKSLVPPKLKETEAGHALHSTSVEDTLKQGAGLVEFNRISNVHMTEEEMNDGRVVDPPPELMQALGLELRKRLGLQTFNVDVLREDGCKNRYYVVDINYLPGYERLPHFPDLFLTFVRNQVDKRKLKLALTEEERRAAKAEGKKKMHPPPSTPYPQLAKGKKWMQVRAAIKLASLMRLSSTEGLVPVSIDHDDD